MATRTTRLYISHSINRIVSFNSRTAPLASVVRLSSRQCTDLISFGRSPMWVATPLGGHTLGSSLLWAVTSVGSNTFGWSPLVDGHTFGRSPLGGHSLGGHLCGHSFGQSPLWAVTPLGGHLCGRSLLWAVTSVGSNKCSIAFKINSFIAKKVRRM